MKKLRFNMTELRQVVTAATPGPIYVCQDRHGIYLTTGVPGTTHFNDPKLRLATYTGPNADDNAAFAAQAHELFGKLLAEVDRLKAEVAFLKAALRTEANRHRHAHCDLGVSG